MNIKTILRDLENIYMKIICSNTRQELRVPDHAGRPQLEHHGGALPARPDRGRVPDGELRRGQEHHLQGRGWRE